VIRVYDESGNVIETHERAGDFKEWWSGTKQKAAMRWSVTAHCEMLLLGRGGVLLGIVDHLRRRFARFKLGAHFLDLRGLLLELGLWKSLPARWAGLWESLFVSVAARPLLATSQLCYSWLGIGDAREAVAVRHEVAVRDEAQVREETQVWHPGCSGSHNRRQAGRIHSQ
jgi:hypothetical protein